MAVMMATKILSPNLWGWLADHTGKRMAIVRLGSLLAVLCFAGVFLSQDYPWLIVVMFLFSFFWNAALPQFEVVTLIHLGDQHHRYSSIRLWGSVGFIAAVGGVSVLLDQLGMELLPVVLISLFLAIWLSSLWISDKQERPSLAEKQPWKRLLAQKGLVPLFVACFLMQVGHGAYYSFYTLYMEAQGYSHFIIGQLWIWGVVAEVGVFVIMHRLLPRFSVEQLFGFSLATAAVRWLLIALFPQFLWLMLVSQIMHAVTFGIYHATAIALIHKYFPSSHGGQGQALYSSISFGAGGAIGAIFSGMLWEPWGGSNVFLLASAISLIAWLMYRMTGLVGNMLQKNRIL